MADHLKLFNLESLPQYADGDLKRDFEALMAAAVKDCTSRPGIDKARKVSVEFTLKPVLNNDGTCDDVAVDVQVTSKAPAKQMTPWQMRATVNGGLKFSPDSPDNPDQGGLFGGEDGGKRAG